MKKIEYQAPEMDIVELKFEKPLMDVSNGEPTKNDDEITDPW